MSEPRPIKRILCILACFLSGMILLNCCSGAGSLRYADPLLPVAEYERLIVGRLDADYIGTDQCLAKCHKHDDHLKNLRSSVHGEQVNAESGLPLVNCESCHGPGSLAVVDVEKSQKCDFAKLLPLDDLPAQAQNLICTKCHSAASSPNLQFWNSSIHANSDVSCFDCHKLHKGPQQKASRKEMADLCYGCHQEVQSQFMQFSRHPVLENKMTCIDCHDYHGSAQEQNLKGITVKDMCTRCHMEYQGPFVFEHADVSEDCTNCHVPHGSPNDNLLASSEPFLCMQCHSGHLSTELPTLLGDEPGMEHKRAFFGRCTNCHSSIHGTDIPSSHGNGTFIAR